MAKTRKPGKRTRSGRLSRAYAGPARDQGTRELQRHRLALCNGSDPALSSTVTGVLLANRLISPEQHRAAERFARARAAIFGMPLSNGTRGAAPTEERSLKLEQRYLAICARLSADQHLAVVDVTLGLRPAWLRAQLLGLELDQAGQSERADLLEALDRIGA